MDRHSHPLHRHLHRPPLRARLKNVAKHIVAFSAVPGVIATLSLYADSIADNQRAKEELLHRIVNLIEELKGLNHSTKVSCEVCEQFWGYGYMLKNAVWEKVLTDEEREEIHYGTKKSTIICLACAQQRLGRPLTSEDFDPKYGINWPILCAMEIARCANSEDGADLEKLRESFKQINQECVPDDVVA